jgi:hypothetical protein
MSQVLRVAWYRFRATFRRRWGDYLAIVLLVGLLGGLAIGAVATARRTQSSFTTFLDSTNPSDLSIAVFPPGNVESEGGYSAKLTTSIKQLPDVKACAAVSNPSGSPWGRMRFPSSPRCRT